MTKQTAATSWSPELSDSLRAAVLAAERAKADTERIDAAIGATRGQLFAAETEFDRARSSLAASESEIVLAGGQADRQARKVLVAARDEVDFISARLGGLEARQKTALAELIDARRLVAIQWRNWQREQATEYMEGIYTPALEEFVSAMRSATAVATALNNNRLTAITRHTVLCDPSDPQRNPSNPRRSNWQSAPESAPIYERLLTIAAAVRPHLEGFEDPRLAEMEEVTNEA